MLQISHIKTAWLGIVYNLTLTMNMIWISTERARYPFGTLHGTLYSFDAMYTVNIDSKTLSMADFNDASLYFLFFFLEFSFSSMMSEITQLT